MTKFATHYWIVMVGDHPVGIAEADARTFFVFGKFAQASLPIGAYTVVFLAGIILLCVLLAAFLFQRKRA